MIDFPPSNFMYDTITNNNFFRIVYCLIIVKVYLHHYREDFGKIDKEDFVFWYVFLYKSYCATAWDTKDLNIGGTNLKHIRYGNIAENIKCIDTLKYYQKRLCVLAATLWEDEKNLVKHLE